MITCQICKHEFKSIISWKHLAKHNITTAEYKEKYGQTVSNEYRAIRSKQSVGKLNPNFGKKWCWSAAQKDNIKNRVAHNKGACMSLTQKEKLRKSALEHHKHVKDTNSHPTAGKTYDELYGVTNATVIRNKIRQSAIGKSPTQESINKALATKRANNNTSGGMKGKTHLAATIEKISIAAKKHARDKTRTSVINKTKMLAEAGFKLINFSDTKVVTIECVNGHQFTRTSQYITTSKFSLDMCPTCFPPVTYDSTAEIELRNWISTYTFVQHNNRTILDDSKEIDIFLPEFNIAIEYNGLYWHNENFKDKQYHLSKTDKCEAQNIKLLHIFEDEWINHKDIVKSRIMSLTNNATVIYARKCMLNKLSSKEANKFLKEHHLQGSGRANVHIGLFCQHELVAVMTFMHGDISKNQSTWEINRFCNKKMTNVVGGASRLFKHFLKLYTPESVVSFADRRWSNSISNVYQHIGFEFSHNSPPNYWYILPNEMKRHHRYGLRKTKNESLTERESRIKQGWLRIWDCGNMKYVWTKHAL